MADGFALRVDEALREYLKDIVGVIRGTEEDEERELQVDRVLEEIRGKELKVATDVECSRLLEEVIRSLSQQKAVQLARTLAMRDTLYTMACKCVFFPQHALDLIRS
jgi:hypothetical protein